MDKKPLQFKMEFSQEKLTNVINSLNKLTLKTSTSDYESTTESEKTKDEEILKKYSNYIKKYLDHIPKSDTTKEIIPVLSSLLRLTKFSWQATGDDYTEGLWKLYDNREFHIFNSDIAFTYYDYFLHMFFLNNKNLDLLLKHQLFVINPVSRKIESYFDFEKYNQISTEFSFGITNTSDDVTAQFMQKNFLIDLLILTIFTNIDIKPFYVNLSTFIVSTESSVMKLFKVLSLFSLCLWQIEKKQNFLGGLLYIVGGVLRDQGKSYLKTKGVLDQNLSYHLCSKDKPHDNGFFDPVVLTTKECDYIEIYFLPIMKEFIKTIISSVNFNSLPHNLYWDDCLPLFYKLLEMEELDQEDSFPSQVEIFHFLNLFLSDFLFFFLTNFCTYDSEKKSFTSIFSYFDEFVNYSLSIFWKGCRNINNMFEFSEKKRKFLEVECDKTEYSMKCCFNHYGLSLVFYLILCGGYNPVNVLNEKDFVLESSFLPLVINKEYYSSMYQSVLIMIVKTENTAEFRFFKDYKKLSMDFLKTQVDIFNCEGIISDKVGKADKKEIDKLLVSLVYEFSKFDEEFIKYDIIKEYINSQVKEQDNLLPELLKLTNRSSEISKILKFYNKIQGNIKFDVESLITTIKTLSLNASILNDDIRKIILGLIKDSDSSESTNSDITNIYNDRFKELINELNTLDAKDNYQMFLKFKPEILEVLENLRNFKI